MSATTSTEHHLHSCVDDSNFATICSFLENFGETCNIGHIPFDRLQHMLEDTTEIAPELCQVHILLLRRIYKSINSEKWERHLAKFCHTYNSQDAWEIERFGYKKSKIQTKLRLLKNLMESQFDYNVKFKNEVNKRSAEMLRQIPLGRDSEGQLYWYQVDVEANLRIYREDVDDDTWQLVATSREEMAELIHQLTNGIVHKNLTEIDNGGVETQDSPKGDTSSVSDASPPASSLGDDDGMIIDEDALPGDYKTEGIQVDQELVAEDLSLKKPVLISEQFTKPSEITVSVDPAFILSVGKPQDLAPIPLVRNMEDVVMQNMEEAILPITATIPKISRFGLSNEALAVPVSITDKIAENLRKVDENLEELTGTEIKPSKKEGPILEEERTKRFLPILNDENQDSVSIPVNTVYLASVPLSVNSDDIEPIPGVDTTRAPMPTFEEEKPLDANPICVLEEENVSMLTPSREEQALSDKCQSSSIEVQSPIVIAERIEPVMDFSSVENITTTTNLEVSLESTVQSSVKLIDTDRSSPSQSIREEVNSEEIEKSPKTKKIESVLENKEAVYGIPLESVESGKSSPNLEDLKMQEKSWLENQALFSVGPEQASDSSVILETETVERLELTYKQERPEPICELQPDLPPVLKELTADVSYVPTDTFSSRKLEVPREILEMEEDINVYDPVSIEQTRTDLLMEPPYPQTKHMSEIPNILDDNNGGGSRSSLGVTTDEMSPVLTTKSPKIENLEIENSFEAPVAVVNVDDPIPISIEMSKTLESPLEDVESQNLLPVQQQVSRSSSSDFKEQGAETSQYQMSKSPSPKLVDEDVENSIPIREDVNALSIVGPLDEEVKVSDSVPILEHLSPKDSGFLLETSETENNIRIEEEEVDNSLPVVPVFEIEQRSPSLEGTKTGDVTRLIENKNSMDPKPMLYSENYEPVLEKRSVEDCESILDKMELEDSEDMSEVSKCLVSPNRELIEDLEPILEDMEVQSSAPILESVSVDSSTNCHTILENSQSTDQFPIEPNFLEDSIPIQEINNKTLLVALEGNTSADQVQSIEDEVESFGSIQEDDIDKAASCQEDANAPCTIEEDSVNEVALRQEAVQSSTLEENVDVGSSEAVSTSQEADPPGTVQEGDTEEAASYQETDASRPHLEDEIEQAASRPEGEASVPLQEDDKDEAASTQEPDAVSLNEETGIDETLPSEAETPCVGNLVESDQMHGVEDEAKAKIPILIDEDQGEHCLSSEKPKDEGLVSIQEDQFYESLRYEEKNDETRAEIEDDNFEEVLPAVLIQAAKSDNGLPVDETPTELIVPGETAKDEELVLASFEKETTPMSISAEAIEESSPIETLVLQTEVYESVGHGSSPEEKTITQVSNEVEKIVKGSQFIKDEGETLISMHEKAGDAEDMIEDRSKINTFQEESHERLVAIEAIDDEQIVEASLVPADQNEESMLILEENPEERPLINEEVTEKPVHFEEKEVDEELQSDEIEREVPETIVVALNMNTENIMSSPENTEFEGSKRTGEACKHDSLPVSEIETREMSILPLNLDITQGTGPILESEVFQGQSSNGTLNLEHVVPLLENRVEVSVEDEKSESVTVTSEVADDTTVLSPVLEKLQDTDPAVGNLQKEVCQVPEVSSALSLVSYDWSSDDAASPVPSRPSVAAKVISLSEVTGKRKITVEEEEETEVSSKFPRLETDPTDEEVTKVLETNDNSVVGEAIEEEMMLIQGEGSGAELEGGNFDSEVTIDTLNSKGDDTEEECSSEENMSPVTKKGRGRPRGRKPAGINKSGTPRKRGSGRKPKQAPTEIDESSNASESSTPTFKKKNGRLAVEAPTRQSSRIAKIQEKEEEQRRRLEEERLAQLKAAQVRKQQLQLEREQKLAKGLPADEVEPAPPPQQPKRGRPPKSKYRPTPSGTDTEDENLQAVLTQSKKRGRKRKHTEPPKTLMKKGLNPWIHSSSEDDDEAVEEEEEQDIHEEEEEDMTLRSDHEFSPESDLGDDDDAVYPSRHARTVKRGSKKSKVGRTYCEEKEDLYAETNCDKCGKGDHPEWILLCDSCDKGWHASCLRPVIWVIPEGQWLCPPCQHKMLITKLNESLVEYDKLVKKHDLEVLRKQRLAYVGISLDNVLPPTDEGHNGKSVKIERHKRKRRQISSDDEEDELMVGSAGKNNFIDDRDNSSGLSKYNSEESEDEPMYKLRARRATKPFDFKEYDEMINSALRRDEDEYEVPVLEVESKAVVSEQPNGDSEEVDPAPPKLVVSKGKVMPGTSDGEDEEEEKVEKESSDEDIDENEKIRLRELEKQSHRKSRRKLNDLDASSDSDDDSDEDFKGSEEDDEEDEPYVVEEDDSEWSGDREDEESDDSIARKGKKGKLGRHEKYLDVGSVRRSSRKARSRVMYDESDQEDDDDEPVGGWGSENETDASSLSESDDETWGKRKKKKSSYHPPSKLTKSAFFLNPSKSKVKLSKPRASTKKKKKVDDDEVDRAWSKHGGKVKKDETEASSKRSTRGKQIDFKGILELESGESDDDGNIHPKRKKPVPPPLELDTQEPSCSKQLVAELSAAQALLSSTQPPLVSPKKSKPKLDKPNQIKSPKKPSPKKSLEQIVAGVKINPKNTQGKVRAVVSSSEDSVSDEASKLAAQLLKPIPAPPFPVVNARRVTPPEVLSPPVLPSAIAQETLQRLSGSAIGQETLQRLSASAIGQETSSKTPPLPPPKESTPPPVLPLVLPAPVVSSPSTNLMMSEILASAGLKKPKTPPQKTPKIPTSPPPSPGLSSQIPGSRLSTAPLPGNAGVSFGGKGTPPHRGLSSPPHQAHALLPPSEISRVPNPAYYPPNPGMRFPWDRNIGPPPPPPYQVRGAPSPPQGMGKAQAHNNSIYPPPGPPPPRSGGGYILPPPLRIPNPSAPTSGPPHQSFQQFKREPPGPQLMYRMPPQGNSSGRGGLPPPNILAHLQSSHERFFGPHGGFAGPPPSYGIPPQGPLYPTTQPQQFDYRPEDAEFKDEPNQPEPSRTSSPPSTGTKDETKSDGEFGGLVSYFSSQRGEEDMDT